MFNDYSFSIDFIIWNLNLVEKQHMKKEGGNRFSILNQKLCVYFAKNRFEFYNSANIREISWTVGFFICLLDDWMQNKQLHPQSETVSHGCRPPPDSCRFSLRLSDWPSPFFVRVCVSMCVSVCETHLTAYPEVKASHWLYVRSPTVWQMNRRTQQNVSTQSSRWCDFFPTVLQHLWLCYQDTLKYRL